MQSRGLDFSSNYKERIRWSFCKMKGESQIFCFRGCLLLLGYLSFFRFSLVAATLNTKLCSIFPFPPNKLYINGERYDGKTQTLDKSTTVHKVDSPHPAQGLRWGHCQWNSLGDGHYRQEGQELSAQATCLMLRGRDGRFAQRIS